MALIKCTECGRDISDTSDKCIHCGCPIEKKKIYNNKKFKVVLISAVILLVLIGGVIFVKQSGIFSLPHTIKNTQLMRLMEYSNPSDIKDELGDDYEHRVWDSLDSTSDEYEDIVVDGKEYAQVELSYESNGDFERIYMDSDSIWTEEEYKILVKDFIEQFGNEYDYEEDEYNGKEIFDYTWKMSLDRRISLSIHQSSDDEELYWVRINSFHN